MADDVFDYAADLAFTRDIRKRLVAEFLDDDGKPPTDDKQARVLLTALKDMDKATIDVKRNALDESKGGEALEIMKALHEFNQLQRNQNPFLQEAGGGTIPTLDTSRLKEYEHVPGEGDIVTEQQTADDFIATMAARKMENEENDTP